MLRARALTSWAGDGTEADPYQPRVGRDHRLQSCADVTGQAGGRLPPSPNLVLVEVGCDADTFAALAADPDCLILESW